MLNILIEIKGQDGEVIFTEITNSIEQAEETLGRAQRYIERTNEGKKDGVVRTTLAELLTKNF